MTPIEISNKFVKDNQWKQQLILICSIENFYEFCKEFSEAIYEDVKQIIDK